MTYPEEANDPQIVRSRSVLGQDESESERRGMVLRGSATGKARELFAPGALWNLWDMLTRLKIHELLYAINHISTFHQTLLITAKLQKNCIISATDRQDLEESMKGVAVIASALELDVMRAAAEDLISVFIPKSPIDISSNVAFSAEDLTQLEPRLNVLIACTKHSFAAKHVMILSASSSKMYEASNLFGDAVESSFPSSSFDIGEAGKCLGLGRYTAAVLHLMRALEPAIIALQNAVEVSIPKTQWDQILNQIEKSLKEPRFAPEEHHWFSEATADFRRFKNAWRNYAMHGRATYDQERSLDIFYGVKSFMGHLSTKLSETAF